MSELAKKRCIPCEDKTGEHKLQPDAVATLSQELDHWHIVEDKCIEKSLRFIDFAAAINFINTVAKIAEHENHHPDIHLTGWNKVTLSLSTHAIDGLSENDFILAAKIDEIGRD